MSGLFGTFNIAKRGMSVQQKSIDVTSHNISNANTEGYSRQRAKIETTRPFAMPSINNVAEPGQLGTGSQVSAIERIRDSFLDYQVRVELGNYSTYDTRYKFLTEIEGILDEPTDTGISNLITEFYSSWQELSKKPESANSRTVVAQKTLSLTDALNHTSIQLKKVEDNASNLTKDTVFEVNNVLQQIDRLNQEIMAVKISGNMPNDLMDKRDLLLDDLSCKFNMTIEKSNYEGIDLRPEDSNFKMIKAVDNTVGVNRLSYVDNISTKDVIDPKDPSKEYNYDITYYKLGDKQNNLNKQTLKVKMTADEAKKLGECRVIWSDLEGQAVKKDGTKIADGATINKSELATFEPAKGDFKGLMSIHEDVNIYKQQVDKLAKAIAWSVNEVHSSNDGGNDPKNGPMLFFVNSTGGSEDDITAENITVNKDILKDVMKINTGKNKSSGESDNTRALAIAKIKDSMMMIQDIGSIGVDNRSNFIAKSGGITSGTFEIKGDIKGMQIDSYFKNIVNTLGVQNQQAKRTVKNEMDLLDSFNENRMSVSGVSLDEEMANLVQFQHAYQANAKVIATVDELLDVVVNGLKR